MASGPAVDLTTFSNALKVTHVFDNQEKQYLVSKYLLDKLRREGMKTRVDGRTAELHVETRGMASFGGQLEHESVSDADTAGYDFGTVTNTTLTSSFVISLQAHRASASDRAAFVKANIAHLNSTVEMFGQNFSRVLWGVGDGAIARVTAIATDTPVAGTHRLTLEADQGAQLLYGTRYMVRGLRLTNSTVANRSGTGNGGTADLQVVAVDKVNTKIDVKGTLGDLAANDILFIGSRARTSKGRMPVGVFAAVDDGTSTATYHGIDRTAAGKDYWKARRYDGIGNADLENKFQIALDDVYSDVGGNTDLALMELAVWRRFAQDLRGDRMFIPSTDPRYSAGTSLIRFTGAGEKDVAIGRDRDVPKGCIVGFDWSTWALSELMPAGWIQTDEISSKGSIFSRVSDSLDWQAVYGWMGNVICRKPGANWIMRGVDGVN